PLFPYPTLFRSGRRRDRPAWPGAALVELVGRPGGRGVPAGEHAPRPCGVRARPARPAPPPVTPGGPDPAGEERAMRIAGAPISWGVCEVPGWGHQLAPQRGLTVMAELGITATELGPQGWLPVAPAERAAALAPYGLTVVGAFVPVVLHDPGHDPLPEVDRELDAFAATGGPAPVLPPATGPEGCDERAAPGAVGRAP